MFNSNEMEGMILSQNISEMLQRASLQSIREFIAYGTEPCLFYSGNFETREREAYQAFCLVLKKLLPDINEEHDVFTELASLLAAYESLYLETGMLVGAKIAKEAYTLLESNEL